MGGVKLLNANPKWTTRTDSDYKAFGFSLCAAPTHNAQCLNLENCGLSPGCTQERERDETLGEAKLIFKTGDKIQNDDNYILK